MTSRRTRRRESLSTCTSCSIRSRGSPQRDPIDGSYVAQTATDLIVSAEGGRRVIPLVGVRRVDVRTGSYWLAGLALGFLADVVTAALIVVLLPRGHAD